MGTVQDEEWKTHLLNLIYSMQQNGQFCDAVIETQEKTTIPIHACVLAAASPLFSELLMENYQAHTPIAMSSDITADVWRPLLTYIYTGELVLPESTALADSFISAARSLQMHHLLRACERANNKVLNQGGQTESVQITGDESTRVQAIISHHEPTARNMQESIEASALAAEQNTSASNELSSTSLQNYFQGDANSAILNTEGLNSEASCEPPLTTALSTDNQPVLTSSSEEATLRVDKKEPTESETGDEQSTIYMNSSADNRPHASVTSMEYQLGSIMYSSENKVPSGIANTENQLQFGMTSSENKSSITSTENHLHSSATSVENNVHATVPNTGSELHSSMIENPHQPPDNGPSFYIGTPNKLNGEPCLRHDIVEGILSDPIGTNMPVDSNQSILFHTSTEGCGEEKSKSGILSAPGTPAALEQVEQHPLDSDKFVVFQTASSDFHILDTSDLNTNNDTASLKLAAENSDLITSPALILEESLVQSDVTSYISQPAELKNCVNSNLPESLQTSSTLVQYVELGPDHIGVKQYLCLLCNTAVNDIHRHAREHEQTKLYECGHCGQKYKNRFVLKRHIEYSHPKESENASCPKCQKSFRTRYHLKRHLAIACDNSRVWQCSLCLRKLKRKSDFDLHMALHTGYKPHICRICFKGFPALKRLRAHMSVHETGEYSCHCGKVFNCEKNYKYHFNYAHNVKNPYRCQICLRSGRSKEWLRKHSVTHTKTYLCKHCKKGFDTEKGLLLHEKMHLIREDNPLDCPICQKTLKSRRTLQRHLMYVHRESSGYKCGHCEKSYKSEKSLNEHKESHSLPESTLCKSCQQQFDTLVELKEHMLEIHNVADDNAPKIFMCVVCKQFFNTMSEYKTHESAHGTPVKCKFCKDTFETLSTLRCHLCSKLYCVYCEALFKTPNALERHTELHLRGKVLFKCDHCTETFVTAPSKQNHIQKNHSPNNVEIQPQNDTPQSSFTNINTSIATTQSLFDKEDETEQTSEEEHFKIDLVDIQRAANEALPLNEIRNSKTRETKEAVKDNADFGSTAEVDINRINNMLMSLS